MKNAGFYIDQRDNALGLVADGIVDAVTMLSACLNYMSMDDVQDMMTVNNFIDESSEDEEDEDEDEDEDGDDIDTDDTDPTDII